MEESNESKLNNMRLAQNNDEQGAIHIDPAIAVAVVLQIVFMVFVGISIGNIFRKEIELPKITIENYSVIPEGSVIEDAVSGTSNAKNVQFGINDATKIGIEESVYSVVSLNSSSSVANHGAKIREGSAYYVFIESLNAYFINLIVDIEDLQQSYRLTWLLEGESSEQAMPKMSIMAFCPKTDEMIYGKFDCKDEYDGRGLNIAVYNLLRYKMFSNFTVGLSDVYDGGPLHFSINVGSNSEYAKSAAVEEVSEYLSSLGFSLDDFDYTVNNIETAK